MALNFNLATAVLIAAAVVLPACGQAAVDDNATHFQVRSTVADLGADSFIWTPETFSGLYYDLDKNIGAERIKFKLTNVDADKQTALLSGKEGSRGIVYQSYAQTKNLKFRLWGASKVIAFLGDLYFAAYDANITSSMAGFGENAPYLYSKSKNSNLLAKQQLSKVLMDSDAEVVLSNGTPLKLAEGYELWLRSVDSDEINVAVELMKDGRAVDSNVVQPFKENAMTSDKTYCYQTNLENGGSIVTIAVHFKDAFHAHDKDKATVDGVFQISDEPISVNVEKKFGALSVVAVDPEKMVIVMENENNPITINKGMDLQLADEIYLKAADQSDVSAESPLRYYLYRNYSEPGSYEIRGQVSNLYIPTTTWDAKNFAGFYYDLDNNLGQEQITFALTATDPTGSYATLSDVGYDSRGITYATAAQNRNFKFRPWGSYQIMGFLGDPYLAAYNNSITPEMEAEGVWVPFLADKSKDDNLMGSEQLSKILLDDDSHIELAVGSSLKLKEGYELAIDSVDVEGRSVFLVLKKNGQEVDSKIVHPSIDNAWISDKTYCYRRDLGDTKMIVVIGVHFEKVVRRQNADYAVVDGVFQISDMPTSIKADKRYGMLSIRSVDPTSFIVTMDNKDNQLALTRNKNVQLFGDIYIRTADQAATADDPLRYYIYTPAIIESGQANLEPSIISEAEKTTST
jgi:S-layer protein (TIGR01567 family)